MIDITPEDFVTLDGKTIPIPVIRAILSLDSNTSCHCTVETQAPSTQTLIIRRDPVSGAFTHSFSSRENGTHGRPVALLSFAELVSPPPNSVSKMVERESAEFDDLIDQGWRESGRTKPRHGRVTVAPSQQGPR